MPLRSSKPRPRFPVRTYHRAAALRAGLDPIIDALDAIPHAQRRAPMGRELGARGWQAVEVARRGLGLPPLVALPEREMPGVLAAEIVSVLVRLATLKPLHRLATPDIAKKSYPRASQQA